MSNTVLTIFTAVAVLILLPIGYMGLYFAMLKEVSCCREQRPYSAYPTYWVSSESVAYAFWPAATVDRQLRPDDWASPWE
jgi:hypothetical protein